MLENRTCNKPDVQLLTTKFQRSNDILKCDWEGGSIPDDWVEQERFDEEMTREELFDLR